MAKEKDKNRDTNDENGRIEFGSSVLNLSKTIANFLADGGLVLSALFMPEPISVSLNWGLGISIAGVALLVWKHGYSEEPPLIVGPYRFVRNPQSLALWLLSFAMAIAARSFPAVILVLVLLPWLFYLEHEKLGKRPDARLLRYRFHVPALIPTLMPFDESPNAGFSWRRAVRINKWPSLARLLSVVVVWIYLLVTYSLKLPWWAGLITAGAYIAIKLFLSQRNLLQISFRKKDLISSNPS